MSIMNIPTDATILRISKIIGMRSSSVMCKRVGPWPIEFAFYDSFMQISASPDGNNKENCKYDY